MTRKMIVEHKEYLYKETFTGTFDEVIKKLKNLKEAYEEEYPPTEYTVTIDYYHDDVESPYYVKIMRLENDNEYKTRIEREKNQKIAQLECARIEYERLKKLFGDLQ